MTHCLIDNSNIINISYAVFVDSMHKKNGNDYVIKEEDLGMFWHLYVHKIKKYITTYKDVIFCGEGLFSTEWRKKVYPLYKENRLVRKENPDYDFIGKCYRDVKEYLSLMGYVDLQTKYCEADDEIYKLSEYFTNKGDDVLIISSDRDLTQISNFFDGVSVYSPITGEKLEPKENILLEKIIVGDSSDNIKGIPRCGKKTFEKMLIDKAEWNKRMTPENVKLFDTIESIVDLRKYPKEYQDAIIENYENYDKKKMDVEGVEDFYNRYGLVQCQREWSSLYAEISLLQNDEEQHTMEDELKDLMECL